MYASSYIWAKVLTYMENLLSAEVISTWFDDADIVEINDQKLVLCSGSDFRKDIIERRCTTYIQDAMRELFQLDIQVEVILKEDLQNYKKKNTTPTFLQYNPQFTFDRFIVGPSNRFAHAAAIAVANRPAVTYNPLFIYGPSGLGKTHLLYAIAGEINMHHPDYNIVYIKGDQFTNELIQAIEDGKKLEFKNKYRNADLFLVDDIQFIAGKDSTQEEFFHTFNTLYENSRQIVMTSDRPPSELLRLEDRLKTRFEWGLIADINPPDYETRMAIIRNKSRSLGIQMPDDVCSYIAENITTNIRQIEGTVKKIKAYRDLTGMEITVPNVTRAIKDMFKGSADTLPTPNLIISEVARFHNISEDLIRSTQKNKGTAEARQVAMYLIRKMTNLSLPDIGKEFNRDHTTVIHAVKKIETALADPKNPMNDTIRDVTSNINNKL